jgi:hypothetical protein
MSPDATDPLAATQRAIALWNEVASHVAGIERELQPLLVTIAAMRADTPMPPSQLAELWQELDRMVEALARRQKQLERAAIGARDTTAARLVRTRIARSRAAGYTPLNPLSPQLTSKRV